MECARRVVRAEARALLSGCEDPGELRGRRRGALFSSTRRPVGGSCRLEGKLRGAVPGHDGPFSPKV